LAEFNQPVDHLPPNLSHLTFGYRFNHEVDHLPPNLTFLLFGYSFNQSIEHLPSSVQHLSVGISFHQPIYHLPSSLTHFTLVLFSNGILEALSQVLSFPPFFCQLEIVIATDYGNGRGMFSLPYHLLAKQRADGTKLNYNELKQRISIEDYLSDSFNHYALSLRLSKHQFTCEWLSTTDFCNTFIQTVEEITDGRYTLDAL
jgi:hypothetical protein